MDMVTAMATDTENQIRRGRIIMKKTRMFRNVSCAAMAVLLLLSMSLSAFAMTPSIQLNTKQEEEEEELIKEYQAVDKNGDAVACVILDNLPLGDVHSKFAAQYTPHIDSINDCFIKLTPLEQAMEANATADSLGLPEEERNALVTATGIGYLKNQALIDLAKQAAESETLAAFVEQIEEGAMETVQSFLNDKMSADEQKDLEQYDIAMIFDITANKKAVEEHKDDLFVKIVVRVDGVKAGQTMFLQHIEADGTIEIVEAACANDGEVNFTYTIAHDGPYMLFAMAK